MSLVRTWNGKVTMKRLAPWVSGSAPRVRPIRSQVRDRRRGRCCCQNPDCPTPRAKHSKMVRSSWRMPGPHSLTLGVTRVASEATTTRTAVWVCSGGLGEQGLARSGALAKPTSVSLGIFRHSWGGGCSPEASAQGAEVLWSNTMAWDLQRRRPQRAKQSKGMCKSRRRTLSTFLQG
jgi:hypothetical protein